MEIWNDGDIATLVQLVESEKYRVIAERIGKSVNAVCAKVKRMRDLNEIPNSKSRAPKYIVPKEQRPADPQEQIEKPAVDWAGYQSVMGKMERQAAEIGDKLLTLEALPDDGCRYVVGDPRESRSGKVYCNGKAVVPGARGKCYCEAHMASMYKAATVTPLRPYEPRLHRREFREKSVMEFA